MINGTIVFSAKATRMITAEKTNFAIFVSFSILSLPLYRGWREDDPDGAFFRAFAALDTIGVLNMSEIILHPDSIITALLYT